MKLSHEEVIHIVSLARLALSPGEIEKFTVQLSHILENFEILQQVDTTNTARAAQTVRLQNVFRDDTTAKSYPQNEILANAPDQEENCFKVRPILE